MTLNVVSRFSKRLELWKPTELIIKAQFHLDDSTGSLQTVSYSLQASSHYIVATGKLLPAIDHRATMPWMKNSPPEPVDFSCIQIGLQSDFVRF